MEKSKGTKVISKERAWIAIDKNLLKEMRPDKEWEKLYEITKKDTLCISKLHTKFSKDVCAMVGFVFYGHFFGENTCDCDWLWLQNCQIYSLLGSIK